MKKHICLGIIAHVDSGKTTLSESILYLTGHIRKAGRVDHGDAFFDTYELEQSRGITIFSKQAVFDLGEKQMTILDTPGHVDFSAEMERTLQVLDYAVLVISGADGIQGHTRTIWRLLEAYGVPVFIFVNKMDQPGTEKVRLQKELSTVLSESCIVFDREEKDLQQFYEDLAVCDEEALEEYMEKGCVSQETISWLIRERKVFPCYYGAALKMEGVQALLDGLQSYTEERVCGKKNDGESKESFGARVFKITRDPHGNRLSHMRVTAGVLKVKDVLSGEKADQIRVYSGEKYDTVSEACAGMVCAVTGLNNTYAGEGLGTEKEAEKPFLEPVLSYRICIPQECDVHQMLRNLRQLEEEDPMLRIVWEEELGEIYAQLMGEVQIEILQSLILERFGVPVTFDTGNIVYKETIRTKAEGVGHFEPLRHYAEVHLILEPGEPGSGLVFDTICSENELDRNWQWLILTHLAEKPHRGVLTGAAVTDMKITLAAGRAHLKHTEGGDFRQSTYRAVRQGLMQAENVLLEPYYAFRLEIPSEMTGRAMTDIQRMHGESSLPETSGDTTVLTGSAPVSSMRDYQREVAGYTRGKGRLSLELKGYEPCHNAEEVIQSLGYDPEKDLSNPSGSVFCAHGAGFYVPWDKVADYMHIENQLKHEEPEKENRSKGTVRPGAGKKAPQMPGWNAKEEKELEEIFIRTYGKYETKQGAGAQTVKAGQTGRPPKKQEVLREYLLVDGYNVIFAWEELKELARENIEGARGKLMDILSNYQGFRKCTVILVFDAYKMEGFVQEIQKYHNIHVVYTKEAETADQYIEKVVHELGRKYHVTVVTSDSVEQVVTLGQGGTLISAREFYEEIKIVRKQILEACENTAEQKKTYLFDTMDGDFVREMEAVRLGKKHLGDHSEES